MPRPSASCTCSLTHSVNSDPAFHQCEVFRRLGRPIRNWQAQAHCPQVYTRVYTFTSNLRPLLPTFYLDALILTGTCRFRCRLIETITFLSTTSMVFHAFLLYSYTSITSDEDAAGPPRNRGNFRQPRAARRYDRRAPRARGGPRETALGGAEPGGVARGTSRSLPRLPRGTPRV